MIKVNCNRIELNGIYLLLADCKLNIIVLLTKEILIYHDHCSTFHYYFNVYKSVSIIFCSIITTIVLYLYNYWEGTIKRAKTTLYYCYLYNYTYLLIEYIINMITTDDGDDNRDDGYEYMTFCNQTYSSMCTKVLLRVKNITL